MRLLSTLILCVILSSQIFAQEWHERFNDLYKKGDIHYYNFDFKSAFETFEEAYNLAVENESVNEIFESSFAVVLTQKKLLLQDEAKRSIRNVINAYSDEFSADQNAVLYNQLGLISSSMSNYEQAISFFDTSLTYSYQNIDSTRHGRTLINRSIAHIYLGNYEEAEENLDEASAFETDDPSYRAFLNLTYYNIYNYRNEDQLGFEYLKRAYEFAKQSNNSNRYLNVLVNLSHYYINQNNYREGLAYVNEGLQLAKDTRDFVLVARFTDNLARIYASLNEYELAIGHFNEAVKIYEQNGNQNLANTLKIQIANIFTQQQDFDLAENILIEILSSNVSSYQKIYVYEVLALNEIARKNYQQASTYLDSGLAELDFDTESYKYNIYNAYLMIPTLADEERLELAKSIYVAKQTKNNFSLMNAEMDLAKAFEPINQDSAFKYAYLAFENLERRRYSTSSSKIKNQLNARWQSFYYQLADWEVKYNSNYSRAFELFELSKSRTLFDQIFDNRKAEILNPEQPGSHRILELQKRIDQKYRQLASIDITERDEINWLELSELELEYQTELDGLMASNSDWRDIDYPEVTKLEKVQGLLPNDAAYISYGIRENDLYIFLIGKEKEVFKTVKVEEEAQKLISELVNNFRDAIIQVEEMELINEKASEISKYILDPIVNELEGFKHLILSPDGPLHLLPFAALTIGDEFLIEQFSIKYLPSFSVYDVIEFSGRKSFDRELLAVAGSGFESGDGFIGSSSQRAFATLPYSIAEVDSIQQYFSQSTILKNEEVTEFSFKNLTLSDYRFIHLAAHGNIDERLPEQSGIILSKKIGTESLFGEDGYLNAREITQLKIPAELVVLSACNTGTGKVISGEGVMGLQRSFLAAGASSVIVSLWNIFDRSTPIFMNKLYDQILNFEADQISFLDNIMMFADLYKPEIIDYKTLAVQQTKIEMINHPYYSHPVHWAPFILTGK